MKKENTSISRSGIIPIILTFLLLILFISANAQDTALIVKKSYYRFTACIGIGSGYPSQQDDYGIGGNIEFALQKQNTVYAIGAKGLEEFLILSSYSPPNSVNSIECTYGKNFERKSIYASVSAGAAWVRTVQRGKYLYSSGSGWFDPDYYEKIKHHAIGFPISAKIFWVPLSFTGIGLELYANINSLHSFYGVNLCRQFGKLRAPVKKRSLAEKILLMLLFL